MSKRAALAHLAYDGRFAADPKQRKTKMAHALVLICSPNRATSVSRNMLDNYLARRKAKFPDETLTVRDLTLPENALPHLSADFTTDVPAARGADGGAGARARGVGPADRRAPVGRHADRGYSHPQQHGPDNAQNLDRPCRAPGRPTLKKLLNFALHATPTYLQSQ
jgi:hypothetical protein